VASALQLATLTARAATSPRDSQAQARSLLELRVRAIRVVDELLVQSQGLVIHESLAAAIALDRSIKLQTNILEGSITAHRQGADFRHEEQFKLRLTP